MKKVLLILLTVVIIGTGYFYFLKSDTIKTQKEVLKTPPVQEVKNTKEVRVGDMVLDVPEGLEINQDSLSLYRLDLYHPSVGLNKNEKFVRNSTPIYFNLSKNKSSKEISNNEWLEQNAPYTDSGSPYSPIRDYTMNIAGNNTIVLISHVTPQVNGGFYDIKTYYIFHKDNVYEIETYIQPEVSRPTELLLNEEELKNIQAYEKTVDQIIQSIQFVE